MIAIRNARLDDVDWIISEGHALASQIVHPLLSAEAPDVEVSRALVLDLIANHLFIVAEVDGERAGYMCGAVSKMKWNEKFTTLQEVLWWVVPKYRKSDVGSALLDVFVKWGEANVDVINMTSKKDSGRIVSALKSMGFELSEYKFNKYVGRLKNG